ncbi:MAG: molybdopterin molybdenumtransferase MoeA [Oscillospiraceae bacterium]|nr:molybdopterin molybdenumtransferase MoeA [Oscillospiraceae bacterium]
MLNVLTPLEAHETISKAFADSKTEAETVHWSHALGRSVFEDITADEYVPSFDRSTVDGYAVKSRDTFGCSESIPALLTLAGEVLMGGEYTKTLTQDTCVAVPTGGHIPEGADAVVMIEYTENYGDGTIGILKPCAPGDNMIYKGDDVYPGKVLIPKGTVIRSHDIGALASIGKEYVTVHKKPVVGIISTGDELVPISETPKPGQVRDVNTAMLASAVRDAGATPVILGAVIDDRETLREYVGKALESCDMVLISGGSSVGMKDATADIISEYGEVLFHGIAIKPGKPTILGKAGNKAIFGLPGHPVAAHFITRIFVRPLIRSMCGSVETPVTVEAKIKEAISSNHGRAECMGIFLEAGEDGLYAHPIHGKSGLITTIACSDGYFIIPRDCEGLPRGATVPVTLYR